MAKFHKGKKKKKHNNVMLRKKQLGIQLILF